MTRLLIVFVITFFSQFVNANNKIDMSAQEAKSVVQNIAFALDKIYLYPERAKYISQNLRMDSHKDQIKYSYNIEQFRNEMRSELVKATLDTAIDVVEEREGIDVSTDHLELTNYTNASLDAEVSDNNIGYFKITGSADSIEVSDSILDALQTLSAVDALIIDLRLSESAELTLVQELISYFLPKGTLLGNMKTNNKTIQLFSEHTIAKNKFNNKVPLFIINSSFVSGEWEFFSHVLQQLNRAVVLGENTMGIAHLTKSVKVGDNIILKLPYAVVTGPLADNSWDETGISPDYFTPNDKAIKKAYDLAVSQITNQL